MIYQSHTYRLILGERNGKRCVLSKEKDGIVTKFSSPVTDPGKTKIYVLYDEEEVVYVGHTVQTIGQISVRTHGKYNYPWLKNNDRSDIWLTVFLITPPTTCTVDGNEEATKQLTKNFGEAVEAEFVYIVREETGKWPSGQHEVHFRNDFSEANAIAKQLYDNLPSVLK
jgi:hypothetical protein